MINPEYLEAKKAFYDEFTRKNPNHPHLPAIKGDIDQHELTLKLIAEGKVEGGDETEQSQAANSEAPAQVRPEIRRPSSLVKQLHEELKRDGRIDIALPEPRPEFLEMQRIFDGEGFYMAPVIYRVGRRDIRYALLDASVRPPYNKGLQMYREDIRGDGTNGPLAEILVRGRESGRIAVPDWVRHVPPNSRFAVSWDEIHGYVAPEVANVFPHLAKQIEASAAELRVQLHDEFRQAGVLKRFAHLGQSNTWVCLYDDAGCGYRLVGGYSDYGGVDAVGLWPSGDHGDDVAFGLQAVMPPQRIG